MQGRILHCNDTAKVFFREPLEDLVGTPIQDHIISEDRSAFQNVFSQEDTFQPYIMHGLHLKGLEDSVVMRFYRNGRRSYCLILLERLQITEEVLVAREESKWADRLQIMLFGISHEIKTPLAIARGYTEAIDKKQGPTMAPKVLEALDSLVEILNNMTQPLRELQDDQSHIDLGESLEMYTRTMEYTEPTKRYVGHFEADIEEGLFKKIRMTKPRFYQILTNLFENAIRATSHLEENARIDIRTRRCQKMHHDQCVCLEFEDNGVGMDEETVEKVFTPYYTTRAPDTGSGLGGYFIYQFVMDAGGSIEVESEKGAGTKFTLHLPYLT